MTIQDKLTDRQFEYISLRSQGLTTEEIREALYLSHQSLVSEGCIRAAKRAQAVSLSQLIFWYGQDNPVDEPPLLLGHQKYMMIKHACNGAKHSLIAKWLNVTPGCISQYMQVVRGRVGAKNLYHLMYILGQRGFELRRRPLAGRRGLGRRESA